MGCLFCKRSDRRQTTMANTVRGKGRAYWLTLHGAPPRNGDCLSSQLPGSFAVDELLPPPTPYLLCTGWVGVCCNVTVKHAAHYLSYSRQPVQQTTRAPFILFLFFHFFFRRSIAAGGRVRSFVRGGEPLIRTRGLIVLRSASPGARQVVRVPTKINSVGSSLTECILVRTFSCKKNDQRKGRKRELATSR